MCATTNDQWTRSARSLVISSKLNRVSSVQFSYVAQYVFHSSPTPVDLPKFWGRSCERTWGVASCEQSASSRVESGGFFRGPNPSWISWCLFSAWLLVVCVNNCGLFSSDIICGGLLVLSNPLWFIGGAGCGCGGGGDIVAMAADNNAEISPPPSSGCCSGFSFCPLLDAAGTYPEPETKALSRRGNSKAAADMATSGLNRKSAAISITSPTVDTDDDDTAVDPRSIPNVMTSPLPEIMTSQQPEAMTSSRDRRTATLSPYPVSEDEDRSAGMSPDADRCCTGVDVTWPEIKLLHGDVTV